MKLFITALMFAGHLLSFSVLASPAGDKNPYKNTGSVEHGAFNNGYKQAIFEPCKDSKTLGDTAKGYHVYVDAMHEHRKTLSAAKAKLVLKAYEQGLAAGEDNPINCETAEPLPLPIVTNETSQQINIDDLITAVNHYYDNKGMWAGKFRIETFFKIRIEGDTPILKAHIRYKSAALPGNRIPPGFDQRIFTINVDGDKYEVTGMSDYMTATFKSSVTPVNHSSSYSKKTSDLPQSAGVSIDTDRSGMNNGQSYKALYLAPVQLQLGSTGTKSGIKFGGISFSIPVNVTDYVYFMINGDRAFVTTASYIDDVARAQPDEDGLVSPDSSSMVLNQLTTPIIRFHSKVNGNYIELYDYKGRHLVERLEIASDKTHVKCHSCEGGSMPSQWQYAPKYHDQAFKMIWEYNLQE